jgi:hypothetical protein
MAEDNDKLLTDDELSAIEDMVASGDLGGEGYNVGLAASAYDSDLAGHERRRKRHRHRADQ